jgi:hypothetical protein
MVSNYKKILTALGLTTSLTLLSTPAQAAAVVAPVVAWVGAALGIGAVAATVVTAVAAVAAVAAVGYAVKAMTPSFDVPDYSANSADSAQNINTGILVNKSGTNNPIPVVYGYRKIGGSRVFVSTDGSNNEYLYIAMVFAEGEINAFKELRFDDKLVASGTLTTQIDNSAYSNQSRLRYELQRGTTSQSPPSWFIQNGWTSNHKLSGLACGYFKCRWIRPNIDDPAADQQSQADANPYGGIPRIQVVIEGKKTPNAASSAIASQTYSAMTKVYTTDPASHLLDYLLNTIYGRGLSTDRVGFASFKLAAEKFATTVNYKTGGTGNMLEFNYVVPTNRTMLENVQTILQNMRSGMPYIQGKFNLKMLDTGHASDPVNTSPDIVYAVTERQIISGVTIEGLGHRDQYNQVKAVFPNPDTNWELDEIVYPEVNSGTDVSLLAEDNGKRLVKEISLEGITNPNIAGDVASVVLLRSRKKKAISFTATAELHNTVVGDVITITYPSLGMSAAQFRITAHQITADYTVQITALEHNPTDYEFANTDVFMPKPVQISSDDQYANGGNVVSGNPYFPGAKTTNPIITGVTHLGGASYKLAITHATDITWVNKFWVMFISTGTNTPWVHPYIGNPNYPPGSPIPAVYIPGPTILVEVEKINNEFPTTIDVTIPPGAGNFLQFRINYIAHGDSHRREGPFKIIARQSPAYNLAVQKASGSTSYP